MADINILISGNLTGFSRLYEPPGSNKIMAESRFKFDNYDYLMFLKPRGKVYSISFSANHLAASVITPILDSFRRPGTLVVSVLIPRKMKVESVFGQNKTALYDLLNELNDRFYAKNYQNGMINQNPAVLMQDYYADIISKYRYVDDPRQRLVSAMLSQEDMTKKLGYVAAVEKDIPLYLNSLCRKNYEGYHYVFIAPDAPKNIDESPEEVLMYRVKILNKDQNLNTLVTLNERIYDLKPGLGEVDFDKPFTYQEVLSGQCPMISAVLIDETIELRYKFDQEIKSLYFEFVDSESNQKVEISRVRPYISKKDGKVPIMSDSYTFIGPEIYSTISLESLSEDYVITDPFIDLRRYANDGKIQLIVASCCEIRKRFDPPYDMPKTITFTDVNGKRHILPGVTASLETKLSGKISDWTYEISADGYETVKGQAASLVDGSAILQFNQIVKPERKQLQPKTSNPDSGFKLYGSGSEQQPKPSSAQKHGTLNWKKVGIVAFAVLFLTGMIVWFLSSRNQDMSPIERAVFIKLIDCEKNVISNDDYNLICKNGFKLSHEVTDVTVTDTLPYDNNGITYTLEYQESAEYIFSIVAEFNPNDSKAIKLSDTLKIRFDNIESADTLKLNVKWEDLTVFKKNTKYINPDAISGLDERNSVLYNFYYTGNYIKTKEDESKKQTPKQTTLNVKEIMDTLSSANLTFSKFQEYQIKYEKGSSDEIKQRLKALEEMFSIIRYGFPNIRTKDNTYFKSHFDKGKSFGYRPSTDLRISDEQKRRIEEIEWFELDSYEQYEAFKGYCENFYNVESLDDWKNAYKQCSEQIVTIKNTYNNKQS